MTLAQKICDAGLTTLAELICAPCEDGGGYCTDVPIVIETSDIPINISEADPIIVGLEAESVGIVISDISIGINIEPEEITTKVEEC